MFLVLFFTINSCSSTKKITKDGKEYSVEDVLEDGFAYSLVEFNNDGISISKLSDIYSANQNFIPEEFSKLKRDDGFVDLTQGFRIQIYSGTDLAKADSIAGEFRVWVSNNVEGYMAEVYTVFKSPNYRVHIGDFHSRNNAQEYTKLVKNAFADAWVVFDSIDPYLVPDENTEFYLK